MGLTFIWRDVPFDRMNKDLNERCISARRSRITSTFYRALSSVTAVMLLLAVGCAHKQPLGGRSKLLFEASHPSAFVGTWLIPVETIKDPIRIVLEKTGHWEWYPPAVLIGGSEQPAQTGSWFVDDADALRLTVETSQSDKLLPGQVFKYEIRSIQPDKITLRGDVFSKNKDTNAVWQRGPVP